MALTPASDPTKADHFLIATLTEKVRFRHQDALQPLVSQLRSTGITHDVLVGLAQQAGRALVGLPSPDEPFWKLTSLLLSARSPQTLAALFLRDHDTLAGILRLFAASGTLADYLIDDADSLDLLRITGGQPVDRHLLVDEIVAECSSAASLHHAQSILRRHQRRELLRIAYGEVVASVPLERTGQQLAFLADAILNAAIEYSRQVVVQRRGTPEPIDQPPIALAVVAVGAYGGQELDFDRHLDVLLVSHDWLSNEINPQSPQSVREFIELWGEALLQLLGPVDNQPPVYELSQRLKPNQQSGNVVPFTELVRYFETFGRTWQRQALIKARVVAGDEQLGQQLIERLGPWIYRRYLWSVDQEGMRGIKRKLLRGTDEGVAEITSVIQFLQLLNAADLFDLRVTNTLLAIEYLERSGCLTMQERTLLSEHYLFFQRVHYRAQLAGLESTPADDQWQQVAASLQFLDRDGNPDVLALRSDLQQRKQICRRIIDHLVHEVFPDVDEIPFETEMILDPEFDKERAVAHLKTLGFAYPEQAWQQMLALATEPIRFLSDRRSRHFLAGIAPKLLTEISATPDPDGTLARLLAVSDSVGGKAALWELFQSTPSTLRLCIRLCAASPYLTGLLTSNPGMMDELMDSLLLDRLPTAVELEENSQELCRFAEDLDPILHSFKHSAHLRIGIRDCLGRDSIQETHERLADTAEACLRRVAEHELRLMVDRYGDPIDTAGNPCSLTMVALGRLGGREPNYHSDLDVLFLYDAEGQTKPRGGGRREGTSNSHFFNELTLRIHKRIGHYGPWGRLYELDSRIRFSHHRGLLTATVDQFRQHYASPNCPLWQRLALVNARVIFGTTQATAVADKAISEGLRAVHWQPTMVNEVAQLRFADQQGASSENLKRGIGGTMDVEAIVQTLLFKHVHEMSGSLGLGTLAGLDLLRNNGWIDVETGQQLAASYRYLRYVESNLRLMDLPARHDLPQSSVHLRGLAYAMRESQANVVVQKCNAFRDSNRRVFEDFVKQAD